MNTTRPMNHQNDFTACRIDISNDLVDQLSHDPLPQSDIRSRIAPDRLQDFVVALRLLPICFQRRVDRPWFEYTEQFVLDCIVHANAAERDTWRLATVEPTTKACVTRSIVILAGVIDHHLPTATSTPHQPRKKRCAALGRARLIRSRQIACQHLADRLRTRPLDITLV